MTQSKQNYGLPALGAGVGLRHKHFQQIIKEKPAIDWFEIIAEDFMDYEGSARDALEKIAENYPIISHSVCIAVGSTDPLDTDYLKRLASFIRKINAKWASDHLCFTMVDHTNLFDLIPLPFTEEAARNVISRVKQVQDILEVPFLLENVTRYITVSDREMDEAEFLNKILEEADCGLLLDVTNVYLNSQYHNYDPLEFIKSLPLNRVGQIHLSGWEVGEDGQFIDSHDAAVPDVVWDLFQETIKLSGPTSVLVEWDAKIPELAVLTEQASFARTKMTEAVESREAAA